MSSDPSLRPFLENTPFFGGLQGAAMDRVIRMLVERGYQSGDVVFREGETGRSMYIIRSGTLLVSRAGQSGHAIRLTRLGPGDFFGETTLIEMQPRSTTLTAETPAQLLELTNMDLYKLYREDMPGYVMVLQNINRELCRRLRRNERRITEMADESGDDVTQIRPGTWLTPPTGIGRR